MKREDYLQEVVRPIDSKGIDPTAIIEAMKQMAGGARRLVNAAELLERMVWDPLCITVLSLAGGSSAGGCMQVYADMLEYNLIDVVVASGASLVDMDFFEALGFHYYQGSRQLDDCELEKLHISRSEDIYLDQEQRRVCELALKEIADGMYGGVYSAREFILEMGRYLSKYAAKPGSLVELAFKYNVPVFCPDLSASGAGVGLAEHRAARPDSSVVIDTNKDLREFAAVMGASTCYGVVAVDGGAPMDFMQGALARVADS